MKRRTLLIAFAFSTALFFTSCGVNDNDPAEIPKPVISGLELGIGNSKIAYIGSDLHIEAEIVAEEIIDKISVEIHKEDGSGNEIKVEYTEFSGKKNTTFHKHIDIPAETTAGEYHFHLSVKDKNGKETTVEEDISIQELVDIESPVITITSAPTSGQNFSNGQSISISGTATDNVSLAGMLIALVYEADTISDEQVTGANTSVIVLLHTHTFNSEKFHNFTTSIAVGAEMDQNMTPAPIGGNNAWKSGNYYLLVKVKDAKNNWGYSSRYPIIINL